MPPDDGWGEWSKHVLAELKRLSDCYEDLRSDVVDIKVEIARLKVKAGVWGLMGGAIPVIVGLGVWMLRK